MNKDAVQHERGPRNSTIRRQVALYLKDTSVIDRLSLTSTFMSPSIPPPIAHSSIASNSTIRPQTNSEISLPTNLSTIPRLIESNSLTLRPTAVCHPTPKVRALKFE
jgi:nuclear receptor subfamily 2 group E protein 1